VENVLKLIVFQLKNERYGVELQQVRSIERLQTITVVPQTPTFIKGVINLRGKIIPILDLNERLHRVQTSHSEKTRILIIQMENIQVGMIVDAATNVLDVEPAQVEPVHDVIRREANEYVKGVAKIEEELIILLDLEHVLNMGEISEIENVTLTQK
jgi:purine-binding chemotaxis protein CheW